MNSTKKKSTLLAVHLCGSGSVLALLLAFYYGVWTPMAARKTSNAQRIAELRSLLKETGPWLEEHRDLLAEFNKTSNKVNHARQRLEVEPDEAAFIREASDLAERSGLEIVNWRTGATKELDRYFETEVHGEFRGSFASIGEFVDGVNQLSRIARVSTFEIQKTHNSTGYPLNATFALYYAADDNDTEQKRESL